ncbi:MAG: phosphatase PAP2 family protein [Fimbriimonadaceae bacterium]|nr:phosphatase PAP2 family protein [Chitinophagales bacterium]
MTLAPAIQNFDEQLFYFINTTLGNNFFDVVLIPIRDKNFWLPMYIIIAGIIIWKCKWKSVAFILLLILNFAATDQVSSALIKPAAKRVRPCNDEAVKDAVILRIENCGVGKSFPSTHATNTFAFAMMLSLLFRKKNKMDTARFHVLGI